MNSNETVKRVSMYRFLDMVACHIDDTPHLYMSASMAKDLANALNDYANDIEKNKYLQSRLSEKEIRI